MLFVVESKKSLQQVCAAMEPTAQKHKFGVLATHNLKETMSKKGVDFNKECMIYEMCNPDQAKKVLTARMDISTMLPCRVSVYPEGERVKIATILPSRMISVLDAPELASVAEEVEREIVAIMKEVAE